VDLLRHLRYFVAVAEELHFGRAAARLGIAQPPLSQRIRTLERSLGLVLFTRTSRRVELTPAGRTLLREARGLLARADELSATMARVREGQAGELRAGVPPELNAAALAALAGTFAAQRPDVALELRELPSAVQVRELAGGALDAGLLRLAPGAPPPPGLEGAAALARPLGVLVAQEGREPLELGDLAGRALVLFPRDAAPEAYDEVLATCHAHGYAPPAVHHAASTEFALGLVLAGDAVALAPEDARTRPGAAWRPLAGAPLSAALTPAWRAGTRAAAVDAFAAAAAQALTAHGWQPTAPASAAPPVLRPSSGLLA
jgi:DNA-binding transcriptional LysR family regulator